MSSPSLTPSHAAAPAAHVVSSPDDVNSKLLSTGPCALIATAPLQRPHSLTLRASSTGSNGSSGCSSSGSHASSNHNNSSSTSISVTILQRTSPLMCPPASAPHTLHHPTTRLFAAVPPATVPAAPTVQAFSFPTPNNSSTGVGNSSSSTHGNHAAPERSRAPARLATPLDTDLCSDAVSDYGNKNRGDDVTAITEATTAEPTLARESVLLTDTAHVREAALRERAVREAALLQQQQLQLQQRQQQAHDQPQPAAALPQEPMSQQLLSAQQQQDTAALREVALLQETALLRESESPHTRDIITEPVLLREPVLPHHATQNPQVAMTQPHGTAPLRSVAASPIYRAFDVPSRASSHSHAHSRVNSHAHPHSAHAGTQQHVNSLQVHNANAGLEHSRHKNVTPNNLGGSISVAAAPTAAPCSVCKKPSVASSLPLSPHYISTAPGLTSTTRPPISPQLMRQPLLGISSRSPCCGRPHYVHSASVKAGLHVNTNVNSDIASNVNTMSSTHSSDATTHVCVNTAKERRTGTSTTAIPTTERGSSTEHSTVSERAALARRTSSGASFSSGSIRSPADISVAPALGTATPTTGTPSEISALRVFVPVSTSFSGAGLLSSARSQRSLASTKPESPLLFVSPHQSETPATSTGLGALSQSPSTGTVGGERPGQLRTHSLNFGPDHDTIEEIGEIEAITTDDGDEDDGHISAFPFTTTSSPAKATVFTAVATDANETRASAAHELGNVANKAEAAALAARTHLAMTVAREINTALEKELAKPSPPRGYSHGHQSYTHAQTHSHHLHYVHSQNQSHAKVHGHHGHGYSHGYHDGVHHKAEQDHGQHDSVFEKERSFSSNCSPHSRHGDEHAHHVHHHHRSSSKDKGTSPQSEHTPHSINSRVDVHLKSKSESPLQPQSHSAMQSQAQSQPPAVTLFFPTAKSPAAPTAPRLRPKLAPLRIAQSSEIIFATALPTPSARVPCAGLPTSKGGGAFAFPIPAASASSSTANASTVANASPGVNAQTTTSASLALLPPTSRRPAPLALPTAPVAVAVPMTAVARATPAPLQPRPTPLMTPQHLRIGPPHKLLTRDAVTGAITPQTKCKTGKQGVFAFPDPGAAAAPLLLVQVRPSPRGQ